jgi:hypothetical protein
VSGPFFGGAFFGGGFFVANSSGVRGSKGKAKREVVLRMSDVQSKESVADFLKSQLKLKHLPDRDFGEIAAREEQKKLRKEESRRKRAEALLRAKAEQESAALEAAQKKKLEIYNHNMKVLMILAASVT